jgi:hypothetical protein
MGLSFIEDNPSSNSSSSAKSIARPIGTSSSDAEVLGFIVVEIED